MADAAEEEGVAPFESRHAPAAAGLTDQKLRDLLLFLRMLGAMLSHINLDGAWPCPSQELRIDQRVIDDDIGARQEVAAFERQKTRVARTGADQVHSAF